MVIPAHLHTGKSQVILGKTLQNGYRGKVNVATQMSCRLIEKPADFDRYLNMQLQRLQPRHIDYYLLHALWKERWERMLCLNGFGWAERALADGRIGHFGFSFRNSLPLFKEVVHVHDNGRSVSF